MNKSADSFYNVRMEYSYSIQPAKRTVVDIPATARLLKELRNKNGYSVKQLLEIFGFEIPEWVDENGEGRCTVGIWFKPLQDDVVHSISKKFQLYKD